MKYYTLLQLNQSIGRHLRQIEQEFWVIAEVASVQFRKHCYLDLVQKEENEIVAKAKAMIWANRIPYLSRQIGSPLEQLLRVGIKVLLRVAISYHEVHGLMLAVSEIEPHYTLGELAAQKQKTLHLLQEKNLLALQKNLRRPLVPQRIAVISSENAAGWKDFQHHLCENPYGFRFEITLFDAHVQGEKAPEEIIAQLENIRQQKEAFDLVVLIRGGGASL
ncbi:MAG: exodeoxyribonuclease VII large subunit, partial [Flammeovirgaceae bacterium]|nr:exodeoxyribonuclease VII large subunit [Flammeovirgaceae bacterium]MDW8287910.1 exodeoxyribonuclease VII large subunit [Flammeovirgaceae bacterium]